MADVLGDHRTEPIVISLARVGPSRTGSPLASTTAWTLLVSRLASGPCAARDFLRYMLHAVHVYNRRIDHLHGRIVSRHQAIHDPVPDASPSLDAVSLRRDGSLLRDGKFAGRKQAALQGNVIV
jgi:hypothetical protein